MDSTVVAEWEGVEMSGVGKGFERAEGFVRHADVERELSRVLWPNFLRAVPYCVERTFGLDFERTGGDE